MKMKIETKILLILLTSVFLGLILSFYFENKVFAATCGNGVCEPGENCSNCSIDCPNPTCGNGICESACGENSSNCSIDCGPTCGNGVCESGENCQNCSIDCGSCGPTCGNGICESGENCSNCPIDCGSCGPTCGNGVCESGENCQNCSIDCGPCGPTCGNGKCESGENCSNCPIDCGSCGPTCGNGVCESGENCSNCPIDCGSCGPTCGNGVCESGENPSNCCVDCYQAHFTKKCYDNDVYWYDCNGKRTDKYQECGSSGWSNEYRCSGNWVQRKYIHRGCSNAQCYALEEWKDYENCASSGKICQNGQCVLGCQNECSYSGQTEKRCFNNYVQKRTCGNYDSDPCLEWSSWQNEQDCGQSGWTNEYRCSGNIVQRKYVNRGCSNNQCYLNYEWRDYQSCGLDKICVGGQCVIPFIDLKVNNSDGPITIPYTQRKITFSWTSQYFDTCVAQTYSKPYGSNVNWSGERPTSGNESVILDATGYYTFKMICKHNATGISKSDSVEVNLQRPGLSVITKSAVITY